jgi:signal transduction histidine kinase
MWLASFACVAAIEPLRGRMLGFLESVISPRLSQLRRLREDYIREMAELHEGDAVARRIGDVLCEALAPRAGYVFLLEGGEWQPAHPFGAEPASRTTLVEAAASVLVNRNLVHLALADDEEALAYRPLLAEGIEVAAAVESGGEPFGLILLEGRASRAPYTGVDLDFVAMAASHAAIALRNAKLAAELLAAERSAVTGRMALGLAHDFGKELDWMSRLVRRLPRLLDDRGRLERDIAMIQDFTEGLVGGLREFIGSAIEAHSEPPGFAKLDDLVERATRQMARVHGPDRITQSIDPATRNLRCHQNLGRVLANLLDNALLATPGSESVHLFSTLEEGWIRIVVQDRGCGISEEVLTMAFQPGFSTRLGEGGSGIGLTVAREIVEALGGSVELASDGRRGTRATVRIPAGSQESR